MADLDALAEQWVRLAREQRAHNSHLRAEANRKVIRESMGHHVLSGNVLVVREEGLVGFVMFGMQSDRYSRDVTRGVIRNAYVEPARRGEGIGSALFEAAENRLAAAGADVVTLEVMADNESARRLYRRLGYEPHRLELEKPLESDTHTK